MKYYKSVEF